MMRQAVIVSTAHPDRSRLSRGFQRRTVADRMDVIVAGGVESISLVQTPELRVDQDLGLAAFKAVRPGGVGAAGLEVL